MIKVNKINNVEIVINAEFIESIESTPDTTITLSTNKKIIVTQSVDDVIDKVIEYKQNIFNKKL